MNGPEPIESRRLGSVAVVVTRLSVVERLAGRLDA